MKKIFAFVLVILMLSPAALADPDLSSYSYDQLTDLYHAVGREIMSRPEWKEILVPSGSYEVGVDIPAGSYTVKAIHPEDYVNVFIWGAEINNYELNGGLLLNEMFSEKKDTIGKIILKEGNILQLYGDVIMSPAQGLGF